MFIHSPGPPLDGIRATADLVRSVQAQLAPSDRLHKKEKNLGLRSTDWRLTVAAGRMSDVVSDVANSKASCSHRKTAIGFVFTKFLPIAGGELQYSYSRLGQVKFATAFFAEEA
jgi:hypothetical protein